MHCEMARQGGHGYEGGEGISHFSGTAGSIAVPADGGVCG
jgi:hypothetical protein